MATFLRGINDAGVIAGYCYPTPSGRSRAFLHSQGTLTSVNYPRALTSEAHGLNNAGYLSPSDGFNVVGFYRDTAHEHGYIATVTPTVINQP